MADRLLIKDDVVESFINDCHSGLEMLQTSKSFTQQMADAAGPNGGLKSALNWVEAQWWIRRGKLIESFEALLEIIAEVRRKYEELDEELALLLQRRGDGSDCHEPGRPETLPAPGWTPRRQPPDDVVPQPDVPGTPHGVPPLLDGGSSGGGGGFTPGGGASSADGGGVIPDGGSGGSPSTPPAGLPPLGTGVPGGDTPVNDGSTPLGSILGFAHRWADLTGRSSDEVIALLVAGMGAAGLISAGILSQLSKSMGSTTIPGEVVEGDQPAVGPSGQSAISGTADDGEVAPDTQDVVSPEAESIADWLEGSAGEMARNLLDVMGVGDAADDPVASDLSVSELVAPAEPVAAGASADVDQGPLDEVAAETAQALQPTTLQDLPSASEKLPDLTPTSDVNSGGGGSAAGGGIELPPLAPLGDDTTGPSVPGSPADLPDLLAVPESVQAGPVDLPDLEVSDAAVAGTAAAAPLMMGGMGAMRGMAPMGGIGSSGGTGGGPSSGSVAHQREDQTREAQDVLEAIEKETR